ncbi:hypothetical protein AAG570_008661, partial [Ranatra chinensis]
VEYKRGLPQVCIPLPTTQRECLFTLRPITNTVGDFLTMIQTEDKAVSTVSISTLDDIRIASSNTIESLMEDDFKLVVNEKVFYVKIPEKEKEAKEKELERLSDIRTLVNQLYVSLNVEEYVVQKEREILEHLEQLKIELEPMEKKKDELDAVAVRRTTSLTWIGLGLMSVQFGILARLTWWEYSWDIMEPVTYFVTYGTAMAAYAYFVLTKQEYLLPDVRDRQHLITVHKRASKIGLDLNHYNRLKESIAQLESDLSRLRDPINPYVPLKGDFSHLKVHVAKHSTPLERTKDNIMSLFNSLRKK